MDARRAIPSVDRLLGSEPFQPILAGSPRPLVVLALSRVQERVRKDLSEAVQSSENVTDPGWYAAGVQHELAVMMQPSLRPAINATGVVLHTNLGRAPLAHAARDAIQRIAAGYSNLEYDIDKGERGSRYVHCAALLRELTGAEDALVVNNNAAAVVLALNTLARGREVVISRGELVEIGGSFRVPEILERSGARLHEVGATNRVNINDYKRAITAETAALLKVHPSNFRISGYTSAVEIRDVATLARAQDIPLIADLGSGLLIDSEALGLPYEPTPREALQAGANVVTMSGDKLLGGPQAGIILGDKSLIRSMRENPLCRALRVDKLTLAALEATLSLYRDPATAIAEIPTLAMLTTTQIQLQERADVLVKRLRQLGIGCATKPGSSAVGGGAYPDLELPTELIMLDGNAVDLDERLRKAVPPVIARIVEDRVAIDLRTVPPEEENALLAAVAGAV